jgi:transcriptional regulator with XRE-family HTH domain
MKFKIWRKGRGWSQETAAAKLNITQSHLCKIEQEKAAPSAELADRIERLTEKAVTLQDLLPKKRKKAA